MKPKDDQSVGVTFGWAKGLTAKIKSRFVSSADRLGAQKLDEQGLEIERKVAVHRAMTEAQLAVVSAATKALTSEVKNDAAVARQILANFSRAEQKASNMEACLALALEDLTTRSDPPAEDGPDELNPDLLARWQHYAEGATTEEIRERWGRVLSGEIRKPGTFSLKTLRVIDELDHETALLFERFCKRRIESYIILIGNDLNRREFLLLDEAGLIHLPEFPRSIGFNDSKLPDGSEWWLMSDDQCGMVVRKDAILPGIRRSGISVDDIYVREGNLRLTAIALTQAGRALSSIIPKDTSNTFRTLTTLLQKYGSTEEIKYVEHIEGVGFLSVDDADANDDSPSVNEIS